MAAPRIGGCSVIATQAQALAWRLDRNFLERGAGSVREVVRRLGAVPAWLGEPDLAVRRRLTRPATGALAAALDRGDLIRTYAFRGAMHLLAAEDAGVYLAVRCANRQWELKSWQEYYHLTPGDWPALREVVRDGLAAGPMTRSELIAKVSGTKRFRHLSSALADPSHTLLKPLAWQGDLCLGPDEGGEATFRSPSSSPGWTGLPDLDDAGHRAVIAYLGAYGPASVDNVRYWLLAGLSAGRRRLDGWLADLADDRVVEVEIDGSPMLHLREHLDRLARTEPDPERIVLLPGYDQWVLGPGTKDRRIVPTTHRQAVTRGSNLVLRAGQVAGTWRMSAGKLAVRWFTDVGAIPQARVAAEGERLAGLVGHDLTLAIEPA